MTSDELTMWPDALQCELDATQGSLRRAIVLRETASTQDAARQMHAQAGDVIVAGRQTRGRGRLGNAWADTAEHGVAMTFVLPREPGERLAVAGAVAAARAAESVVSKAQAVSPSGLAIRIKWPNDVYAAGRKLAGILIEQHDQLALIGIGMNVTQSSWPDELAGRAVSLAQLGVNATRLDVMLAITGAMNDALRWTDDRLETAYNERNLLRDQTATFRVGNEVISGRALGLSIASGLHVTTETGERWLPAAITRVDRDSYDDRGEPR